KSVKMQYLNTQGQQKLVWPATVGLARAYLDQLERSQGLDGGKIADARKELDRVEKALPAEQRNALIGLAARLEREVNHSKDAIKVRTLASVVKDLASAPVDQAVR
ncbi:MAG: LVIVD repeat-containing protein, partial [Acidimicrobiia bacterium]